MKTLIDIVVMLVSTIDELQKRIEKIERNDAYPVREIPSQKRLETDNTLYSFSEMNKGTISFNEDINLNNDAKASLQTELNMDNWFKIIESLRADIKEVNDKIDLIRNPHTDLAHFNKETGREWTNLESIDLVVTADDDSQQESLPFDTTYGTCGSLFDAYMLGDYITFT